ncbi:MAG: sulfatase [Verrucomicrobiae bacterium]|nr:sulfatase [Verrucomicrobiae bacterium]MCP5550226.1 sulfatase [Akkermansiaceae bacterium]
MKHVPRLFALAAGVACVFAAPASPRAADAPPNIVLILSDDQSWTDYGFMGHEFIETPHLDALAARSAVFKRGYVPTALCRPSLMTLATGLYVHQHLTSGNDPSPALADPKKQAVKYDALREALISHVDRHPTIAKMLGEKGYLSHQSGKWWEGNYRRGGFTHGMTRGFPEPGGRHGDDGLKIGRQGMEPVFSFIDEAVAAKKPFYVWYAPFLPHSPHTPPRELFDKYKAKGIESDHVARYHAMCEWFDQTCGQLIDYVDGKGLTDNTLFVYLSDNGWIQSPDKPKYAPRSKQSANEGGTRQPILFSWPGVIQPGDRGEQLCSSVDIVPTMLGAAGAAVPKELPGIDLMPVLKSGEPTPRKEVFGEGCAHDVANIDKPEDSLLYRWVVEGKWKLLLTYDGAVNRYASSHPRDEKRPQLFDLIADPTEEKNLAAENPEVVARLAKKIADWWPVTERKVVTEWTE